MRRLTAMQRWSMKVALPSEPSGCWQWAAGVRKDGYAWFRDGKTIGAHRYAYRRFIGEVPAGLVLDHLCRNRACVNPAHLELVTRGENVKRGMSWSAVNARKTHCPKGHPFHEGNTYRQRLGRSCLACRTQRNREASQVRKHNRRRLRAGDVKEGKARAALPTPGK